MHDENPLLVAVAALAAAALFDPLRRRVQATVDRRFNRARYDAQRAIEAFANRLRDKVDLDELSQDLNTVVAETVAPAKHVLVGAGGRTVTLELNFRICHGTKP